MIHMLNSKCIAFYGLSPHHAPRDDEPNNHYWSYLLHNTPTLCCTVHHSHQERNGKIEKILVLQAVSTQPLIRGCGL